jgi:dienelactone hydrolase
MHAALCTSPTAPTRALTAALLALAALLCACSDEAGGSAQGGTNTPADTSPDTTTTPDTAGATGDTQDPDPDASDTSPPDTFETIEDAQDTSSNPDTADTTQDGEDAQDAADDTADDTEDAQDAADVITPLPNPSGDGPFAKTVRPDVTLQDRTFSDLKGTVCQPADDAGAPYPLVIISPGFSMNRDQYRSYCEHLATWGFVAVVQTYQGISHTGFADSVGDIIDWALSPTSGVSVDPDKIATAGHSLGGKVSILAAIRDDRVKAVVAWDPVDTNLPSVAPELMPQFQVPLALLGETLDSVSTSPLAPACAPADNNYMSYFNAASSRPVLAYTIAKADHMDWVDDPTCFLCGACRPGEANHLAVKALTRRTTVAFLTRHLLGDTSLDTYTIGAQALADEAAGIWTIQSR